MTAATLTDGAGSRRHPKESDVQGSWEQCQDPLSIEWTTVPVPYSHDDARDFVLGFVPDARKVFIGQESEGGMITFLDVESGEVARAVSGFELSGRVRQ